MFDERYARQVMLPEIGEEGQHRLASASVLLVGLGGLGSTVAPSLAGAGVGRLGLCDPDVVSWSNLPRQTLYTEEEVGRPKCEMARRRLAALSSATRFDCIAEGLTPENAEPTPGQVVTQQGGFRNDYVAGEPYSYGQDVTWQERMKRGEA